MKIHYKLELEFDAKTRTKARERIQLCLNDAIDDLDAKRDGGTWTNRYTDEPLGTHQLKAKKAGPRRR